ncbi:hypothetical protein BRADI_1g78675v3 [Brachypodium distachyon]|uniref:Uncharacterized protein n=1 Tax=Brachypodium distachyon TaxID=15368 RepID=A0A0Q3LLM2_BRADI|nr:hypothetical protein BRADI_1g78675v3 [Brachypodium distachyon]
MKVCIRYLGIHSFTCVCCRADPSNGRVDMEAETTIGHGGRMQAHDSQSNTILPAHLNRASKHDLEPSSLITCVNISHPRPCQ